MAKSRSFRREKWYQRLSDRVWDHMVAVAISVVLILGGGWFWFESTVHTHHTRTITICSKEAVTNNRSNQYRVYTPEGTYAIVDSHWFGAWRTNSGDYYSHLKTPGTYKIVYIGYRNGFMSKFPNIMSYVRVADNKPELAKC